MHSALLLLSLVSSAFAAPLPQGLPVSPASLTGAVSSLGSLSKVGGVLTTRQNDLVGVAANVIAQVAAAAQAAVKINPEITALVGNVNVKDISVGHDAVTNDNILSSRDDSLVAVPVTLVSYIQAILKICADVAPQIDAAAANAHIKKVDLLDGAASNTNVLSSRDSLAYLATNVLAIIDAVVHGAAQVSPQLYAAVGNIQIHNVDILNNAASYNHIAKRDDGVEVPVRLLANIDALVTALTSVYGDLNAAVLNVKAKDVNVGNDAVSNTNVA